LATGIGVFVVIGCAGLAWQGPAGSYSEVNREEIQRTGVHPVSSDHVVHLAVPFFPDDTDQCGPATIASVLTYWGIPVEPPVLRAQIYLRRLRGTLPIDLFLAAQAQGLQAKGVGGTLDKLKAELDAGRPVVALLNLGGAIFPQGHYVVITGYSERQQGVYMHSGLDRDLFVPYDRFLGDWKKAGRWMLRAQPKEDSATVYE
jgi:ABC-type bacteriocin/lantibiotic exporter with double-glycine peptidase domain